MAQCEGRSTTGGIVMIETKNSDDWESFRRDILSGALDRWKITETDRITGKEEIMSGRTLRLRFEANAADLVVSGLLSISGRLH